MTNTHSNEKKAQTMATYVITVSSHLTPEELQVQFSPSLMINEVLEIHTEKSGSTELILENVELTSVEWIDEDKK